MPASISSEKLLLSQLSKLDLHLPKATLVFPGSGGLADELDLVCSFLPGSLYSEEKSHIPAMEFVVKLPLSLVAGVGVYATLNGVVTLCSSNGGVRARAAVRVTRREGGWKGPLSATELKMSCALDSLEGLAFFARMETTLVYNGLQSHILVTFEYGSALMDVYQAGKGPTTRSARRYLNELIRALCYVALQDIKDRGILDESVCLDVACCLGFKFDYDSEAAACFGERNQGSFQYRPRPYIVSWTWRL
ncbi:hypothetical protein DFH11DRAFT_1732256 [Phellopilus nigrolimitatus]|nr:hypothetical protein DFH11DRAFT_1732256 [Phellopilus nigrolimitatus]